MTIKLQPIAVSKASEKVGKRTGGAKPGAPRIRQSRPKGPDGTLGLTRAEEAFTALLLQGEGQSNAYRAAFPQSGRWSDRTVHAKAHALANKDQIRMRFAAGAEAAAAANDIKAAEVIRIAAAIARFDFRKLFDENGAMKAFRDIDADTALAIASFEVIEQFEGTGADRRLVGVLKKVKAADKNVAITNLMRHFGLFEKDNEQQAGVFDPEALTAKFGDAMQKAMDRQAAMLEERRKRRSGGVN